MAIPTIEAPATALQVQQRLLTSPGSPSFQGKRHLMHNLLLPFLLPQLEAYLER